MKQVIELLNLTSEEFVSVREFLSDAYRRTGPHPSTSCWRINVINIMDRGYSIRIQLENLESVAMLVKLTYG